MSSQELFETIREDLKNNPILLYIKGEKTFPSCGFSARVIKIFNELNVPYVTRNVLKDEELRQGLKEFSTWPTFPQIYINGELVGGCDIVTELYQSGELQKMIRSIAPTQNTKE